MNKPLLVGIAGGSGSGKTLFLNCFLKHFQPADISLISQDNYYKPKDVQPRDENGHINFDLPECIDEDSLYDDITSLLEGSPITRKEYTFNTAEETAPLISVMPAQIIIIEGIFIFHFARIAPLFDRKVFLDACAEISLRRRLKRDVIERGYSNEMTLYQWKNHVMPAYELYLHPYKDDCHHVIVNNSDDVNHLISLAEELSKELKDLVQR